MKTALHLVALCALLTAAACGPSQTEAPAEPTPEEMGQDDPNVPMEPPPEPNPVTFEAMSKTAEAFTGAITLTAEPRSGPNAPPAMKLVAANGLTVWTELLPGGAEQATVIDWKALFGQEVVVTGNAAPGAPTVDMHSIFQEDVPATATNGGFCGTEPTSFIAMATGLDSAGQKFMSIAAFKGDVWPPASQDVLCGTFNYIPPAPQ
jgi:hypothetical protein